MQRVTLLPLKHRGALQIGVQFKYNETLKDHLKELKEVRWSRTHKMFYLLLNSENKKKIYQHLRLKGCFVDFSRIKNVQATAKGKASTTGKVLGTAEKMQLNEFVSYLEGKRYSKSTVKTYHTFVRKFLEFNKKELAKISNRDIEIFVENVIANNKYSVSSHRQCISALKHFCGLYDVEGIDIKAFERPKKSKVLPTVLSKEEVIALLQNTKNLKHRAVLALIYSSGLRIGELLNLRLRDFDFSRMQIHVRQSKGRKDRYVIVAKSMMPLLNNYLKTYRPKDFFVEGRVGEAYSSSSVRFFLRTSCKRAGITKKVTPHTLRHSFATHMMENGIGLRHIQDLLGHSKPETTMIYTHVTRKDLMQIQSPLDATVSEIMQKAKDNKNLRLSGG